MKISLSNTRKTAVSLLIFYTIIYYSLIFIFSNQKIIISDLLSIFGEITSLVIIGVSFNWQEEENKIVWKIFFAGTASYLIGDLIWSFYEIILDQEVPLLSICDVFYLLSSICYFVAFTFYIRKENPFNIIRTVFDTLITMTISLTFIWKFILIPIADDSSLTLLQKTASLAYPIFDIGYLGAIFSLFFLFSPKAKRNKSNLLLSAAFLIWFFADQCYLILENYTYISGGFLDPLWPIGYWILALVPLYSESLENNNQKSKHHSHSKIQFLLREYFRFLFPYISAFFLIIIVTYQYVLIDPLIAGIVISVMLIMIRQIFSLLENQHLISLIQQTNQSLEENKTELNKRNIELQRLNYLKEHEANTDFLTGLFNRRYINRTLSTFLLEKADKEQLEVSLLMIDIDHFKQINDQQGHEIGDMVLQKIAILIKDCIRSTDVAGRIGGDEFIAVLPNTDLTSAQTIAGRLVEKTSIINFTGNGEPFKLTLSIGCTRWKGAIKDFDMNYIISNADRALYKAKKCGRNQFKAE